MRKSLIPSRKEIFSFYGTRGGHDVHDLAINLVRSAHLKFSFDNPAQVSATGFLRQVTEAAAA